MESTAVWESEELELMGSVPPNGQGEWSRSSINITNLRELALRLLREVQSMGEVHTVNHEGSLDFYEEVGRFEVDLIKRALLQTAGHQVRAARLLNLKVSTLNSKIKRYNLNPYGLGDGYPPVQTGEIETRQQA